MGIEFLRLSPQEAIIQLRNLLEEGYQTYNQVTQENAALPSEQERQARMEQWTVATNIFYAHCGEVLTGIYTSSLYFNELHHVEIMSASFPNESPEFTTMRRVLRARLQVLRKNYDFIIQHSNPRFTVEGNLQLNITAGRDINNAPSGEINTNNDTN